MLPVRSERGSAPAAAVGVRPPSRPRAELSRGSLRSAASCGATVPRSVCERAVHQERDACNRTNTPDDSEGDESEEKADEDSEREEEWDTDLEIEETKEPFDPTGKTRYIAACQLYRVVPISYFLRHMKDSELIMKHHGLGTQGAKALSLSLMTNTSIVKLNLSDNWLDGEGAAAVAEMLKENCYISGNEFDDHAAKYLSDALPANNKMESLDLSHNMLGDASGEVLGMAIAENTGLKELNMSWNYFRNQGAAALARGFEANMFLRVLDLSYNGFSNNGAAALGEALKVNNVLEELNISNNRISLEGALRFAVGLKENQTLKRLNMARNPMQSEGCFGILKSIQANSGAVVEILDFSEIPVNKDFADLCDAVKMLLPNLQIRYGGNATLHKKEQPKVEIQSWFSVEGDS
ncbi:leucine-rich repeat-containing protein 74B isoform X4 [Chelonia mydas]|uniref:leucine-rich repeat-containing protein 74B isoform X4 n=1 Tax=Chelonia mydas TaxID=8469 RepID=UPI001CA94386|nr:leucine-rich repeat-containing protein 74B isoform X4 [Chelonia mydas]